MGAVLIQKNFTALTACAARHAGTFTASDVQRIKTAFVDSLLVVEKDGIMQVCTPQPTLQEQSSPCVSV